jgi:hypothetical protein
VVVVALPPIGPSKPEPLHPVNPSDSFCANKPGLALPAEGAPLVFATQIAHDLVLHIEPAGGQKGLPVDLPVKVDPGLGGLVFEGKVPTLPGGELNGVVVGKWGFDDWEGPHFHLVAAEQGEWALAAADQSALVVGRDDIVHFQGQNSLCVEKVEELSTDNHHVPLIWKSPKPDTLDATIPLENATPGTIDVAIYQYGIEHPDQIKMTSYESAASLERLTLSAGDKEALLKGTRLDQVARARIGEINLSPSTLTHVDELDQLVMNVAGSTAALVPGKTYQGRVNLKDGRELKVPVTVDPPRPQVTLLSKGVQDVVAATPSPVQFNNPDDLPVDGRVVFFLKSSSPEFFPRDQKVEVAAADSSFHSMLSLSDGSLMLEDAKTAVGTIEPLTRFGNSAFGPVRIRAISADGAAGDWLNLGTLVRLPVFKDLRCPRPPSRPCILSGSNLFLIGSVSASSDFSNATDVPAEFTGNQLAVPHPSTGVLYLKLRDDPATAQTLTLPVIPITVPAEAAALKSQPQSPPPAEPAPDSEAAPAPASDSKRAPSTPPVAAIPDAPSGSSISQPAASAAPAQAPASPSPNLK